MECIKSIKMIIDGDFCEDHLKEQMSDYIKKIEPKIHALKNNRPPTTVEIKKCKYYKCQVSNTGKVYDMQMIEITPYYCKAVDYYMVGLKDNEDNNIAEYLHILIAITFFDYPVGYHEKIRKNGTTRASHVVDHINNQRGLEHHHVNNLRWCSYVLNGANKQQKRKKITDKKASINTYHTAFSLGTFRTSHEAMYARNVGSMLFFGVFAGLHNEDFNVISDKRKNEIQNMVFDKLINKVKKTKNIIDKLEKNRIKGKEAMKNKK